MLVAEHAVQAHTHKPKGTGGRGRRTEPRHTTNYPTLLRSEPAGIGIIRVLDVSASGLRVATPFRLDCQSEVEIRIEGTSVLGVVGNGSCLGPIEFHVLRCFREVIQ